jgi:hypothetical protein
VNVLVTARGSGCIEAPKVSEVLYRSGEKICGFVCEGIILSGVVMAHIAMQAVLLALLMCLLAKKGKITSNH